LPDVVQFAVIEAGSGPVVFLLIIIGIVAAVKLVPSLLIAPGKVNHGIKHICENQGWGYVAGPVGVLFKLIKFGTRCHCDHHGQADINYSFHKTQILMIVKQQVRKSG
jgi:hypothetical protein